MRIGLVSLHQGHWDTPWQMGHQLLTRLPDEFEVLWMEPPHSREEAFQQRAPRFRTPDTQRWPRLHVYTPQWWLPRLYRPRTLADATASLRLQTARRHLESLGCERTVLYLWRPESEILGLTNAFDAVFYHIHDEYSFTPDDPPTPPSELEVLRSVDQVIIHSPTMMRKKGGENPNSLFLPNGVDFHLYDQDWPEPDALAGMPRPRVGYTGFLKNQLDWDLIHGLVSEHPDVSFVFVGPARGHEGLADAVETVQALPNALFPGMKPPEELAAWVQHFDVCIMPYRNDGYTRYIYPLKLHEYLATGHPVVASPLPNLEPFKDLISFAEAPGEWEAALEKALEPDANTPEKCAARKDVARAHDWSRLAERLGEVLRARALGTQESGPHPDPGGDGVDEGKSG